MAHLPDDLGCKWEICGSLGSNYPRECEFCQMGIIHASIGNEFFVFEGLTAHFTIISYCDRCYYREEYGRKEK